MGYTAILRDRIVYLILRFKRLRFPGKAFGGLLDDDFLFLIKGFIPSPVTFKNIRVDYRTNNVDESIQKSDVNTLIQSARS